MAFKDLLVDLSHEDDRSFVARREQLAPALPDDLELEAERLLAEIRAGRPPE